jgi:hypothetical protein
MTTTTRRFAQLLRDAQAWDKRHQGMCHAQQEWLLENFAFGDQVCVYANLPDRQKWDIPKVAAGHLYTVCEGTR